MSPGVWFLIYAFAIYRLSELVSRDLIFDKVRKWVAKKAAAGGVWKIAADWIHCPLCIGVWFALPAAFIYGSTILNRIDIIHMIPTWFGMAGIQYFLSSRNLNED